MPFQRAIRYVLFGLLLGITLSSCAIVEVRTSGQGQTLRWHATDFRQYTVAYDKRESYDYTLVLQDLRGTTVTFTTLQGQFRNNHRSRRFEWKKVGQWVLPAGGELRIPLGTYRRCRSEFCRDWGRFAPVWHLVLMGTDGQGQPVREAIEMQLPYVAETS